MKTCIMQMIEILGKNIKTAIMTIFHVFRTVKEIVNILNKNTDDMKKTQT